MMRTARAVVCVRRARLRIQCVRKCVGTWYIGHAALGVRAVCGARTCESYATCSALLVSHVIVLRLVATRQIQRVIRG